MLEEYSISVVKISAQWGKDTHSFLTILWAKNLFCDNFCEILNS